MADVAKPGYAMTFNYYSSYENQREGDRIIQDNAGASRACCRHEADKRPDAGAAAERETAAARSTTGSSVRAYCCVQRRSAPRPPCATAFFSALIAADRPRSRIGAVGAKTLA